MEQVTITGTITDSSGTSVPRAKVTVTNDQTLVNAVTETNDLGYYRLPYLAHGESVFEKLTGDSATQNQWLP